MPKSKIFLYAGILFLVGVGSAGFGLNFAFVLALWIAAGILMLSQSKFTLAIFFVFCAALVGGNFYFHFYANFKSANLVLPTGANFSGVVVAEPERSEKAQRFPIALDAPYSGEVLVVVSPNLYYAYGDRLGIQGKMQMNDLGVPEAIFPKIISRDAHHGFWLMEKLLAVKTNFLAEIEAFLPPREAALMSGILLGDRSGFGSDLKAEMAASGTTHIVALSGYNVSIIVIVISQILGYWFSRRKKFYLTLGCVALFVLMTGAQASLVRAAIMGALVLIAAELGRAYAKANAIVFTALLMTLWDPALLTADLGFELSFLSLLGIIYLLPALKSLFRMREEGGGFMDWKEVLLTTLSAQLAVMPVVIKAFGSFSLLALVPNLLILEIMPFTMLLGAALGIFGFISYYLGMLLGKFAHLVLAYELAVIGTFAKLQVPMPDYFASTSVILLYYAVIIVFVWIYEPKTSHAKI